MMKWKIEQTLHCTNLIGYSHLRFGRNQNVYLNNYLTLSSVFRSLSQNRCPLNLYPDLTIK